MNSDEIMIGWQASEQQQQQQQQQPPQQQKRPTAAIEPSQQQQQNKQPSTPTITDHTVSATSAPTIATTTMPATTTVSKSTTRTANNKSDVQGEPNHDDDTSAQPSSIQALPDQVPDDIVTAKSKSNNDDTSAQPSSVQSLPDQVPNDIVIAKSKSNNDHSIAAPTNNATTSSPQNDKAISLNGRAKKQPAATTKNATATDAIKTPKPEAKTRTKKVKQTAETKKTKQTAETKKAAGTSTPAGSVTTPATTLASTQPLLPISSATTSATPTAALPSASDKKAKADQRQNSTTPAKKRKPRATPATDPNAQPTNPPKRTRKKKGDQAPPTQPANDTTHINPPPLPMSSNMTLPPLSVNPQLLSVASNVPMGASPLMSNAPQPTYPGMQPLNRNLPGMSPLDVHDHHQRYMSVSLSPYANLETNSLARQHSLSKLLFTSSSGTTALQANPHSDEIAKAFEELRDHSWTHLSKCILEPAQQFDIPSLIGTLYELRADNEKQLKRVKDLTLQREQLAAMNAKLDLTGPMLLQNLNQTSPSFASVAAALQNSPKSLPNSSPSPAMNKSPIVPGGAYNHVPPGSSLGPPGILYDRNSPMVGLQTQHSGVNSLKSSMISTPSPPTSAFMAHGANNRSGLMTINNSPYMSSVHPSMSALNPLGGQAPPSYYPRQ